MDPDFQPKFNSETLWENLLYIFYGGVMDNL